MRVLTYGDIMDGGTSVFTTVAKLDAPKLIVSFSGAIRVDNPYRFLSAYVSELEERLPSAKVNADRAGLHRTELLQLQRVLCHYGHR